MGIYRNKSTGEEIFWNEDNGKLTYFWVRIDEPEETVEAVESDVITNHELADEPEETFLDEQGNQVFESYADLRTHGDTELIGYVGENAYEFKNSRWMKLKEEEDYSELAEETEAEIDDIDWSE